MPGDVGLVASAVEYVLKLFVEEDKLPQVYKRWKSGSLRKQADAALAAGDMERHAALVAELKRMSDKP